MLVGIFDHEPLRMCDSSKFLKVFFNVYQGLASDNLNELSIRISTE